MKLLILIFLISKSALSQERKLYESDYVNMHCKGQIECVLPDKTSVDCLTDTRAIEYGYGRKWAEAVGQSFYYSAMTERKAGIVLITSEINKVRYLKRIMKVINKHGLEIDIWLIEQ